jgi:hypothetical protein
MLCQFLPTTGFDALLYGGSQDLSSYGGQRPPSRAPMGGGVSTSGGISVISLVAGSLLPTPLDSSKSTPPPTVVLSAVQATVASLILAAVTTEKMEPPQATAKETIKDKPSDLGIKPITDKDTWIDANKVIDACLCRPPYWPVPSKELVTTADNVAASVWWEEVVAFFCKPPVLDLFVEMPKFDGKGSKMLAHINNHFNPSGTVDTLSHIFDLIDLKLKDDEPVVSLKVQFSRVFSSLKMGGISIDSALQVGFMLRALLSRYQAVIQEFCVGHHSLTVARLQIVIKQCINFDKDPWSGPVDKDGKVPCSPLANAAGTNSGDGGNAYNALVNKSFNYHFAQWKKAIGENKGQCMFCHDTARNTDHKTKDCPILKKLGMKLDECTDANNWEAVSRVALVMPALALAPASNVPPASNAIVGSSFAPGGLSAAAKEDAFDSGDEYEYEGKWSGAMYSHSTNRNNARDLYIGSGPYCRHASTKEISSDTAPSSDVHASLRTSSNPQGIKTIYLPKSVLNLLQNPSAQRRHTNIGPIGTFTTFVITDTRATNHMLPNKTAFISYTPVLG